MFFPSKSMAEMLMEFHITLQGDFWWYRKNVLVRIPNCYLHNGSSCQCLGNPMAFVSTSGYCDNKSLNLAHNSFRGSMALSQYNKQQRTEYSRLATSGLFIIHACFNFIGSWGITGITRFHTRP